MGNKGFTLIELLLSIALLTLISIIIAPEVFKLMKQNEVNACNSTLSSIMKASSLYVKENKYDLGITCSNNTKKVSLTTLYDYDQLTGKVDGDPDNGGYFKNPVEGKDPFYLSDEVTITYNCDTLKFTYSYKEDNYCE